MCLLLPGRPGRGKRLRARGLAHPVQLVDHHVQAEEVLEGLRADGGRPGVEHLAAVEAKGLAHLLVDDLLAHRVHGSVLALLRKGEYKAVNVF